MKMLASVEQTDPLQKKDSPRSDIFKLLKASNPFQGLESGQIPENYGGV